MTEEKSSASASKEPKKPAKKARVAPPPPKPDEGILAWRTWAILGAVLVGGVVAWRLLGTSYKHDLETICNAEKGSGLALNHDASKVQTWVKDHLGTPEGNQFYATLNETKLSDRSKKLQDAASQAGVSPCPVTATYDQLSAQGDARSDVQHLCSQIGFPKLLATDEPGRVAMLQKWIDTNAKSPDTKTLGAALAQAATGQDRAKVLSDAAAKLDIYTCANARTLETPPPVAPTGAPTVKLFADAQIVGSAKDDDLKKALAVVTPDLVACYTDGLTRHPDLAGKLLVKMEFDATGKAMRATPADDQALQDPPTATCIVNKLRSMKLPVNGPLASVMLPLELTHEAN
jgi:hypothetical protein